MSDWLRQLATTQISALAGRLETAQQQALPENSDLGHSLCRPRMRLGPGCRTEQCGAESSGSGVSGRRQGTAELLRQFSGVASLNNSRQTLKKAGAEDVQKGQVGFRRPGTQQDQQAAQPVGTPAGTGSNGQGTKVAGQNGTDAGNKPALLRRPECPGTKHGVKLP